MIGDHPLASTIEGFRAHLASVERGEAPGDRSAFLIDEYRTVIRDGVEYYSRLQNTDGAIVDPDFSIEWHYSTPAFALAAAYLVRAGEAKVLPATIKAIGWACKTLADGNAGQGHSNFYTSQLLHAIDWIRSDVPTAEIERWYADLARIDPESIYFFGDHQVAAHDVHNWNLLALAGEFRRRRAGLTEGTAFFDRHIGYHIARLTDRGLYVDGSVAPGNNWHPLAYDLVGRGAFIDLISQGWDGEGAARVRRALEDGSLTQLFFQDPNGEYVCQGRSSGHIWNEAAVAHLSEWAARHFAAEEPLLAKAFRRQAQLSLCSMKEWYAEAGRFHVVKNRFHPAERHGFEQYTVSTTYNLWALAALARAADVAVESITPSEIPGERFSYVVDSGEGFHQLVAACDGTMAAVELAGDPNYSPTGVVRIAVKGVPSQLGPSEGSVSNPKFSSLAEGAFLAHGPAWRDRLGNLHTLAELMDTLVIARFYKPYLPEVVVQEMDAGLQLRLSWRGGFAGARRVELALQLFAGGARVTESVDLPVPPASRHTWMEAHVPILETDGERDSEIEHGATRLRVRRGGHSVTLVVNEGGPITLDPAPIGSRIGLLKRVIIPGDARVSYTLTFSREDDV